MSSTEARGAARLRGRPDADDPVLMSKVVVPELPGWAVTRPRIEELIAKGARGPLTSVTGPPGAGKTMAIASWAATSTYPCVLAWVTLDDYDNKPRVFWSYVVAALRRAGILVPRVLPGPTREAVEHAFLVRLASVLARPGPARRPGPRRYSPADRSGHLRRPGLRAAERLSRLASGGRLKGGPACCPCTGTGLPGNSRDQGRRPGIQRRRVRPAPGASGDHPFRGGDQGTHRADRRLGGGDTAGRAVVARAPDPEQFVRELEGEDTAITGYLVDEVLNAQPPPVRDMLLRTSILECVNADLASELTGAPSAAHSLAGPRAGERLHPADRARLVPLPCAAGRRSPPQAPDRVRRAGPRLVRTCSAVVPANGMLHEAVRYAPNPATGRSRLEWS